MDNQTFSENPVLPNRVNQISKSFWRSEVIWCCRSSRLDEAQAAKAVAAAN
jgi:hypothetical protein